jgi:hypothetical protein
MAQLNTFKSLQYSFVDANSPDVAGVDPHLIYTAPAGYTAIVLNAQAANIKSPNADVTVTLKLDKGGVENVLIKELVIPPNDAANLATGKLVLQSGDKLVGFIENGEGPNALDLTLSFLETLDA